MFFTKAFAIMEERDLRLGGFWAEDPIEAPCAKMKMGPGA
jgi:hypothetical protein